MAPTDGPFVVYQQLADWYERRSEARQRDLFLVLAADAALTGGRPDQAEQTRQRLLQFSPYHLLRPYPSLSDAMQSAVVVDYLEDLRQQFPPPRAAQLLEGLRANSSAGVGSMVDLPPVPPGRVPGRKAPGERSRRPIAPSPYDDPNLPPLPPFHEANTPVLTWVPGLLFVVVLLLSAAWGFYVFVGPFLE